MSKRLIKFRAWIPSLNKIIYIGSKTNDTAVWIEEDGFDVVEHFTGSPVSLGTNKEGVELMQFTGLTDKNGKEIYEGDILIHTSFPNQPQQVYFKDGAFYCGKILASTYHSSVQEIIGNIYENPELLIKNGKES